MSDVNINILENTFRMLPGVVSWKDKQSVYMGCNTNAIKLFGFKSDEQLIGYSDANLKCDASETVRDFLKQDQAVITHNKSVDIIDINVFSDNQTSIFSTKKIPIVGNNNIPFGILVQCLKIENPAVINNLLKLSKVDSKYKKQLGSYILEQENTEDVLSDKEKECLFYVLRGKTAPQIALILSRSKRTVETHIEHIKFKLNCYGKAELIEAAIQLGMFNYIPKHLLNYPMTLALNLDL
ncbi:MAG: helix-turn-helix transcriptional regulator [Burkholderiales bacterium]|nr:helix-turn-helix transcriptional regulator [Burkholderiales bacterium]